VPNICSRVEYDTSALDSPMTSGARVLVADDLTPVLTAIGKLLENSFVVVGMVSDGQTALDAALGLQPDLVLLDISMPGMSGIEVARELKKRGSKARIVFLTVHDDPDIVATCLAAGGIGYVQKVNMDTDLVPAMNDALEGRIFVSRSSSR
jgi:DNA-binding NarL/FixJ family response regulator